jgi:hypothetical protein
MNAILGLYPPADRHRAADFCDHDSLLWHGRKSDDQIPTTPTRQRNLS